MPWYKVKAKSTSTETGESCLTKSELDKKRTKRETERKNERKGQGGPRQCKAKCKISVCKDEPWLQVGSDSMLWTHGNTQGTSHDHLTQSCAITTSLRLSSDICTRTALPFSVSAELATRMAVLRKEACGEFACMMMQSKALDKRHEGIVAFAIWFLLQGSKDKACNGHYEWWIHTLSLKFQLPKLCGSFRGPAFHIRYPFLGAKSAFQITLRSPGVHRSLVHFHDMLISRQKSHGLIDFQVSKYGTNSNIAQAARIEIRAQIWCRELEAIRSKCIFKECPCSGWLSQSSLPRIQRWDPSMPWPRVISINLTEPRIS